jgi:uncharacterized protein YecE (DUF72 family)
MPASVRIGTSGFALSDWVGPFYPAQTRRSDLFRHYARRLRAVEICATFHRWPAMHAAQTWATQAGPEFRICLAALRRLTRDLGLTRSSRDLQRLRALIEVLGPAAGPVLLEMPSSLTVDLSGLERYLQAFAGLRIAVDLPHPSWRIPGCLRLLSRHEAALVVREDSARKTMPDVTADFSYWRLANLNDAAVELWAERAAWLSARGVELFAFVRPDRTACAGLTAEALAQRTAERLRCLPHVRPAGRVERAPAP